jgi:hypothetical protein
MWEIKLWCRFHPGYKLCAAINEKTQTEEYYQQQLKSKNKCYTFEITEKQ